MSARKTVVRTTSANERPPALRTAPRLSNTRRVCAAMSPLDDLPGGRIERHLAGDEQQLAGANGLRVRADRLRGVGAGDGLLHRRRACFKRP